MFSDGDTADAGASATRGGALRRPTIGFLGVMVHGFYWGSLLAGMHDAVTIRGGRVIALQTLDAGLHLDKIQADPDVRTTARVAWNHMDAVVVAQQSVSDEYLSEFARTGKPIIGICRELGDLPCPTVLVDSHAGITALIDHLIEHGHTRIGFVSRDPADPDDDARVAIYREVMQARGLRPRESALVSWRVGESLQADSVVQQLLSGDDPPTAVVASTDMAAFTVIKALDAAGISVPRDMAVVGFDDVEDAATFRPALTTVAQSFTLTGAMAGKLACDVLEGHPVPPTYHYAPVRLVTRESCGCGRIEADGAGAVTSTLRKGTDGFVEEFATLISLDIGLTDSQRHRLRVTGDQVVDLFTSPVPVSTDDVAGRIATIAEGMGPLLAETSNLLRIVDLIRALASAVAAAPNPSRGAAASAVDRLVSDVTRTLVESHAKQVRERPTMYEYFDTQRQYYVISSRLLQRNNRESLSLDWLVDTEVRSGCLALWAQGDDDGVERALRVVGAYDSGGGCGAGEESGDAREFPPAEFLDILDRHPSDLLYLLSVRFDMSDWGFLALIGPFDVQDEPTFERFNHWAAMLTVALDQDHAMRSERALLEEIRNSEERYALAADATNDGLWDWNLASGRVYYSMRWKALVGYADDEIGSTLEEWLDRVHPDDRPALEEAIAEHRDGLASKLELEYRLRGADGSYHWMSTRGRSMCDESGRVVRLIGSMTDVTHRKLLEERLRRDALYDALTGLANRTLFLDRLGLRIERAKRTPDTRFAVVYFDLNGFKMINDSLGHHLGDEVLVETGRRLVGGARSCDTVARLGGDEFVLLLDDVNDASSTLATVHRILSTLSQPMVMDGRVLTVGAAAGVAVSTTGRCTVEEFLRNADAAMYRAKALGNGAVVLFDRSMHTAAVARQQLELDLRKAVADDQFELRFQPILRLDGRRAVGTEALICWNHPVRGPVMSEEFLAVADTAGLIQDIGRWTVRAACSQLRIWLKDLALPDGFAVHVNLSNRQFWDPELCAYVQQALTDFAVPSARLVLEVAESAIMHNHDQARGIMERLRKNDVRLCLDDFGAGYASLVMLQTFPIDILKIDASLIRRMCSDGRSRELARIMFATGLTFDVEVVAQGVETERQAALLVDMGCPLAQGRLFSQAVPARELSRLLG